MPILCGMNLVVEGSPKKLVAIPSEYEDLFPKDLQLGLPTIVVGHNFKIDFGDEILPIH